MYLITYRDTYCFTVASDDTYSLLLTMTQMKHSVSVLVYQLKLKQT